MQVGGKWTDGRRARQRNMSKNAGEKCGKLCISSILSPKRDITPTKITPWGRRGRIRPQHPLACRKRRLNGAACLPWAATRVA